ncbi:MAG TPA: glycosyltransferase family 2 protein [Patescibacteria group bacterium]|nr:glycosyltransferase family 2 protein [Patescibacteria group bacterium]
MSKLSTVIIAKNAENLLADCLDSISFSDEIILIDSGSTDRTKEVAERFKAKVYELKTDDFSEIRNLGLKKAEGELVFYIDVDERVDSILEKEIINLKLKNIKDIQDSFFVQRKNYYLGSYEWPKTEKILRLFKKDKLKGWKGKLHESPIVEGENSTLNGFLLHFTHRDLSSMLNKTIKWSKTEAELRFNTNHPKMTWWRFPRVMITAFFDYYIKQGGYKVGTAGFIESIYQAFSIFITYARLWELQQKKTNENN